MTDETWQSQHVNPPTGYLSSGVYYVAYRVGMDLIPNHPENTHQKIWLDREALRQIVRLAKEQGIE